MRKFVRARNGNVGVLFAIAIVPLMASAGVATDFLRAFQIRTLIQTRADAAALASAADDKEIANGKWAQRIHDDIAAKFGDAFAPENIVVNGGWLSKTDYRVDVSAEIPTTLLRVLPDLAKIGIAAESVARITKPVLTYKPPKFTQLDPDAADYNRMYVYCFNPEEASDPDTHGRSQEVAIADDAGTEYNYTMPICGPGETISYRLHNVRNAHDRPADWDRDGAEHYEYYTDTRIVAGVEHYDLQYDMVETVLCDNYGECKAEGEGGIIPEGPNRTPEHATAACSNGKFLYYGWEDRPPGGGSSDRDYNDIRIITECPVSESEGSLVVRLIK
ncbi:hypothetical protein BH10PSE7_BH10PSE7_41400 [soil metagenome]